MNTRPIVRLSAALALLCLFVGSACDAAPAGQKSRAHGLELTHPEGWSVTMPESRYWLIEDAAKDAQVIVLPFIAARGLSSAAWFERELGGTLGALLPGAHLDGVQPSGAPADESLADLTFTRNGAPWRALALCRIAERGGLLYVISAPRDHFDAKRATMLGVLRSVRFTAPDGNAGPAGSKPVALTTFRDPNEGAFSIDVPKGWQVQGGTLRRAAVDVVHCLVAQSPNGEQRIQLGDCEVPAFVVPTQMLAMTGFTEGSMYSPGYGMNFMVRRYLPGTAFLDDYLPWRLGEGLRIASRNERPELVQELNAIAQRHLGGMVQMTRHAGESRFSTRINGQARAGYAFVMTMLTDVGGNGNWNMTDLLVVTAPKAKLDETVNTATRMLATLRLDPGWVARQQQMTGEVSRVVSETNAAIAKTISDTSRRRDATLDHISEKWSDYLLDQTVVRDNTTGEQWKVEYGSNTYWLHESRDTIVGSERHERPSIDFTPLEELH